MMKKIKFYPQFPHIDLPIPQPASKFIPQWYKNTPPIKDKELTAKRCVPLIDAFSFGYILVTPCNLYVSTLENGEKIISEDLNIGDHFVTQHLKLQVDLFEIDKSFNDQPFKFINFFNIATPRGYSCLFVHPINRTDLPFYTLTGVVDTDKHPVPTNFPFFIKQDFEGLIPVGTPIVQIIPFKRKNWNVKIEKNPKMLINHYEFNNPPFAKYKRESWTKKTYQ